jgi:hypothetical protein
VLHLCPCTTEQRPLHQTRTLVPTTRGWPEIPPSVMSMKTQVKAPRRQVDSPGEAWRRWITHQGVQVLATVLAHGVPGGFPSRLIRRTLAALRAAIALPRKTSAEHGCAVAKPRIASPEHYCALP